MIKELNILSTNAGISRIEKDAPSLKKLMSNRKEDILSYSV